MSIPLLPEFDTDGSQVEPSTAKINEMITAVNSSLTEAGLLTALGDSESSVATAVAALGGSIDVRLSTNSSRLYDNKTAGAGETATLAIEQGRLYGALICITESDKALVQLGIHVTEGAVDATIRLGVYGLDTSHPNFYGLAGARMLDAGTVNADTTGRKTISLYGSPLALDPGFWWVQVAPSENVTVDGYASLAGQLGEHDTTSATFSGTDISLWAAQTEMPATLSGELDNASRVAVAPRVYFRIADA